MEPLVVEVARRGKLLVGEPFFVPGMPLTLDRKGAAAKPGDLAVVRRGRGRARIEQVLGPAKNVDKNKKDFDAWLKAFK